MKIIESAHHITLSNGADRTRLSKRLTADLRRLGKSGPALVELIGDLVRAEYKAVMAGRRAKA